MRHTYLASTYKILNHLNRVNVYLKGEPVYPVTLELNITARCNRHCKDCPSILGRNAPDLSLSSIRSLFKNMQEETPGLIVTGGEPTLHPDFPVILREAHENGFKEIAVITNGSFLNDPNVYEPLLKYASAVRVSLYDWNGGSFESLLPTLERINALHNRIVESKSQLTIGTSALTQNSEASLLPELTRLAVENGANWIYFLPCCTKDPDGNKIQLEQGKIFTTIHSLKDEYQSSPGFDVFCIDERYNEKNPSFRGYHAAYFIFVVGSDGCNYLSSESKYKPDFMLLTSAETNENPLFNRNRLSRIAAVHSEEYSPKGNMNRGILYSDLIQKLIDHKIDMQSLEKRMDAMRFLMVNII